MQLDLRHEGYMWFDLVPYPDSDLLAGRIFQAGDLVHEMVVQSLDNRVDHFFQISEIHDPAEMCIEGSVDIDHQAVGMPVNGFALVAIMDIRKKMGRIKGE